MEKIPKDPVMLLSYVNTKLRDFYPSLHIMCEELEVNEESIVRNLKRIDYVYDQQRNQFL